MAKKINYGKLLRVIFLTVLIWVWADRAKTESLTITTGLIKVNEYAAPNLWISVNNKVSVPIDRMDLVGSASKIDMADRRKSEGKLDFVFLLDPEKRQELKQEGKHSINVVELLRASQEIKQLGLTVGSCQPRTIEVVVKKLDEKKLNIQCVDDSGALLSDASIDPATVSIPAPKDWTGAAKIKLTVREAREARVSAITKTAFIELEDGQKRQSATTVKVQLSPTAKNLTEYTVEKVTICYGFSPNLKGKYDVELINPRDFGTVNIKATPIAKQAYEQQPFQILLYIRDEDLDNINEAKQKKVIYLFPEQYVRNDEIELNGEPVDAKFKLIPLPSVESGAK
jgi:hypothetical protein